MKLAQISDIHLNSDRKPIEGIDTWSHFERVMLDAVEAGTEFFVFTGDICNEEDDVDACELFREAVEEYRIPFAVIPGNHDTSATIRRVFPEQEYSDASGAFYRLDLDGMPVVFLDTGSEVIDEEQYLWIAEQMENPDRAPIVFMHHPPMLCGMPFMDTNYALADRERIQELLFNRGNCRAVFCGHYHTEMALVRNSSPVFITPATWYQLRQDTLDWHIEHTSPGYRVIELTPQQVRTSVRYPQLTVDRKLT